MPRKHESLRAAIVRRVKAAGLNARELSERTGGAVSHDQIWRFLRGDTDLTTAKADAIMRALGISLRMS